MSDPAVFMRRAIEVAYKGLYTADPNPRVGCVICSDERVVAEGYHRRAGGPHAEIEALNNCSVDVAGATVYVTLEPCSHFGKTPPCCDALIEAGVAQVVIGGPDPNPQVAGRGIRKLREAGIEVIDDVLRDECEAINPGFFSRMQRRRPYVRVKLAASLDGRTALADGYSQWITGEQARYDVQHLRARAGAILTGSGTVLHDDPRLNVRLSQQEYGAEWPVRQPLLAIVDSQLKTPLSAKLFQRDSPVVIYSAANNSPEYPLSAIVVALPPSASGQVDLPAALRDLADREINELHVEAGPQLFAALLAAQLVDELIVYVAPVLLGRDARELVSLPGIDKMQDRPEFSFTDVQTVGRDLRLTLAPHYPEHPS